jgi:hypothetical protein
MYKDKDGYNIISVKGKQWREHRYVWTLSNGDIPKGMEIDHINGKRDDNRIENLQMLTKKQNNQRFRRGTTYLSKNKRQWVAERDGNYLGGFYTKCRAIMACNLAYI